MVWCVMCVCVCVWFWYPGFEGGQTQSDPDCGLVGIDHRVVVDVAVVAHSDWLVVVLVDAVKRVDWLCGRRRGGG